MKTFNIALAAAGVLIAGCATASLTEAKAPAKNTRVAAAKAPLAKAVIAKAPPPVTCKIVTTPTAGGLKIEAVVTSQKPLAGSYDLAIRREGAYGASEVVQGGPFTAKGGQALTLSSSEMGADQGARLKASLVIRDKPGVACRHDVR